ncbi:MAG: stage III sporulation protein AG [Eubacteriales bacterium]|nr:stage III sporulation protein AG [Eubacteriales bacterium]
MKVTEIQGKRIVSFLLKNRYVLAVMLLGLILILLPTGDEKEPDASSPAEDPAELNAPSFSLEKEEARLEKALCEIEGAGTVRVLLSLQSTSSRELAENGENEVLVVDSKGGGEETVALRYCYPEYLGAVVVCTGGDRADVRLDVVNAVSAFTGLRADKIQVIKMK